ncbi:MAG: ATP-binding cassette domain-containing protein [Oscillospiraceae bacterium]
MIEIKNLCKSFDDKKLFDNFSTDIQDGEFVIISGKSGCGKTTLLNIIGSIEDFQSGTITVDGTDITNRKANREYLKTKVGFLFQNFALVDNKTVRKNLELVKKECRTDVSIEEALDFVGLKDKENTAVYKLSGGEQQRIALARLLVKKCDVILADEPTGSLDRENAELVMSLLDKLNKTGKTIVVVTHDEQIRNSGRRVINL